MQKPKKITIYSLQRKKEKKTKIVSITSYDYPTAILADEAGVDIILVGDSIAMTVFGYENTLKVTMEEMISHTKAVVRGVKDATGHSFVVGDMPFMSYQPSNEIAVQNAGRFMSEAGCDGVKLEGGIRMAEQVEAIVKAGIPVMGHIGLTPQSTSQLGGYRVQGKTIESAKNLIKDALALQEAGAFSIVLEAMPTALAENITKKLSIPTIGIGSGSYTDGQVVVLHDILSLFRAFTPKFVKKYANIGDEIYKAISQYAKEVQEGIFPSKEHQYEIDPEIEEELRKL
jgi:3-methyl-2-oxobutanoate hydroxymethyltransferase